MCGGTSCCHTRSCARLQVLVVELKGCAYMQVPASSACARSRGPTARAFSSIVHVGQGVYVVVVVVVTPALAFFHTPPCKAACNDNLKHLTYITRSTSASGTSPSMAMSEAETRRQLTLTLTPPTHPHTPSPSPSHPHLRAHPHPHPHPNPHSYPQHHPNPHTLTLTLTLTLTITL